LALAVTLLDLGLLHLSVRGYFLEAPRGPAVHVLGERVLGTLGLLLAQAAFFWAALLSPRPAQAVALTIFGAVVFLQYGFVTAAGGVLNVHDIAMSAQNVKYTPSMIAASIDWRAVASVALVGGALVFARQPLPRWGLCWLLALALIGAVHGTFGANQYLRRNVETDVPGSGAPPMSVFQAFLRTVTFYVCEHVSGALRPVHRQALPALDAATPTRHIVLVIDESVSATHLSVNGYERATTPWLDAMARRGALDNWGPTAAASTYSDASVCVLLTGVHEFPDSARRLFTLPTIFQYARAMGYRTHLLDGEQDSRRFGLSWSDLEFVDDWRNTRAFGDDHDSDFRVASFAATLLREHAGQFIVILKRGNHEPPDANVPRDARAWGPDAPLPAALGAASQAAVNAYDSALRYNLDRFFQALLGPDGDAARAVVLYTSDHAEALGEDGGRPFVRRLTQPVVTVPMMMFGRDRPRVDTGYRASHANMFPTLLDLMGVPDHARVGTYGRSLLRARAVDRDLRPVLGGDMFGGPFFYEVRDFDQFDRVLAAQNAAAH
jgi:glucan phosphoethanolaminetransferase (alkaline phosphatase superfamily)